MNSRPVTYLPDMVAAAFAFLGHTLDRLSGVSVPLLALGLAVYLLSQALRAKAWEQMLQLDVPHLEVRYPQVLAAFVAGSGANAFIPAHGGDLVRLVLAKRAIRGIRYPALVASVLALLAVDVVLAVLFVIWGELSGNLPGPQRLVDGQGLVGHFTVAHPIVLTAAVGVVLVALVALVRALLGRFAHRVDEIKAGFAVWHDWRKPATRVLPWQVGAWLVQVVSIVAFLSAFHLDASLSRAATVQAAQGLALALPLAGGSLASQALLVAAFSGKVRAGATIAFFLGMRLAISILNVVVAFVALAVTMRTLDLETLRTQFAPSALRGKLRPAPAPLSPQPAVVPVAVDEEPRL